MTIYSPVATMLDPRIYRAALLPVLLVVIVVAFSLENRPGPLRGTLAPDAFDGVRASRMLDDFARRFPSRRAGSAGDSGLAAAVAAELQQILRSVPVRRTVVAGETLDGAGDLVTVTARAPGSTPRSQIVLVAQRDAAADGARADLSGTAALVEMARVLAVSRPARSVTFASISGASGGQAGMRALIGSLAGPVDAVIEIGDMSGPPSGARTIVGWAGSSKAASQRLQRTVSLAIRREAGASAGFPFARTQLARFALPLSVSGQAVALDSGIPAIRISRGGELPSDPRAGVSDKRMALFGQSLLSVVSALDGPLGAGRPASDLVVAKKVLPAWALRLLAAALLLPAALTVFDAVMRHRRRGGLLAARLRWVLAMALPFVVAWLLVRALGITGAAANLQSVAPPGAVPLDGGAWTIMGCGLAAFALVALYVRPLAAGRAVPASGDTPAGLAVLVVAVALAAAVWLVNPYASLLLVLPVNLWLLIGERSVRLRRGFAAGLVFASLIPVALVFSVYADELSMRLLDVPWFWTQAVAGGDIGPLTALGWSIGAGTALAALRLALRPVSRKEADEVTVRGPVTYAGPGSLGGTESALRR